MIFQNCLKFHLPIERLVKLRVTILKYHYKSDYNAITCTNKLEYFESPPTL